MQLLAALHRTLGPLVGPAATSPAGEASDEPQRPLPRPAATPAAAAPDAALQAAAGAEAAAATRAAEGQQAVQLPPGYNGRVEQLQQHEFKRLSGRVYADYAGAAPYSEQLLAEVFQELGVGLHGNPHSETGWASENRSAAADAARQLTLRMCNADPERYHCIFTSGATAALKLVGESYPWGEGSAFLYLRDNHNSVLGVRQLAAQHGAACSAAVEVTPDSKAGQGWGLAPCGEAAAAALAAAAAPCAGAPSGDGDGSDEPQPAQHLFAFPLESNLTGLRYDPGLVTAVQQGGCAGLPPGRMRVLLDCAKACGSAPPDLSAHPADFAVLSFYKVFGYPTGLGALLVRRDALPCLRRRYFGGGTVEVCLADEPFHSLRPGPAGWEDGTQSFLDFPAVAAGLRFIDRLGGFRAVAAHADAVAASLACQLASLRHGSGAPLCMLYGGWRARLAGDTALPGGAVGQGPVVAFNLLRADGSAVGYREVERLASLSGIMLRTGCCCNPGACAAAVGLSSADMRANFEAGHMCWDGRDVLDGRPTGVVRASFGYASSLADADAISSLAARYWLESTAPPLPAPHVAPSAAPAGAACLPPAAAPAAAAEAAGAAAAVREPAGACIEALWVYPVKSCRGFSPAAWPLGPAGLLHDRCWVVVDGGGAALRLKQNPRLAAIQARVDLGRHLLVVRAEGEEQELLVPLPEGAGDVRSEPGQQGRQGEVQQPQCGEQEQQQERQEGGRQQATWAGQRAPELPKQQLAAQQRPDGPQRQAGSGGSPAAYAIRVCSRLACGERAAAASGGEAEAAAWFSRVLGLPCRLMRVAEAAGGGAEAGAAAPVAAGEGSAVAAPARQGGSPGGSGSFANEGQLLVLGAASLADLRARCSSHEAPAVFAQRFRPNLVVGGTPAYAEDGWRGLQLATSRCPERQALDGQPGSTLAAAAGAAVVLESAGPCARCDMVCADPLTGRRAGPEPLLTLAGYRRGRGRICLGLLMNRRQQAAAQQEGGPGGAAGGGQPRGAAWLQLGSAVRPLP